MDDVVPSLLVVAAGAAALSARKVDASRSGLIWGALVAHWLSAIVQILLTTDYYQGGDMLGYFEVGRALAELIELDPATYVPEVVKYFLQENVSLPVGQYWEGTSTGSMAASSAFILLVTGRSLWAACLAAATIAFFAKVSVYDVLRERLPAREHRLAAAGMLLLPSAAFWVSGLVKESLTVSGMCLMIAGAYRIWRGRSASGGVMVAAGGLLVSMLKPYVLFPTCSAMIVWWYWQRALLRTSGGRIRIRPAVVLLALASAVGVVILLGQVFPDFAVDRFAEEAADYQSKGEIIYGGSTFSMGDPSARTISAQLAFVPIGLVNVLFRPFFFEVRNAVMAMNALETSALLVMVIVIAARRRWRRVVDEAFLSPEIVFCLVLAFTMALGVGLTTTNLGTLSRYRVPMMPFLALAVLLVAVRARESRAEVRTRFPGPSRELLERARETERPPATQGPVVMAGAARGQGPS